VDELLSIVLPLLAGLIVFVAVMRGIMSLVRRRLFQQIRRKFSGQTIIRMSIGANFFGQTSRGLGQIRGNGALVLTPNQLHFALFAPRRELTIELGDVVSLSTPRVHLGKTMGAKLLRVDFRADGGEDAAAWAVRDLEEWVSDIERYRGH
jgi:hypothetical protein